MTTWCETLGPSHQKENLSTDQRFEEEKTKKSTKQPEVHLTVFSPSTRDIRNFLYFSFNGFTIWRRLQGASRCWKIWTGISFRRGAELHPQRRMTKREEREVAAWPWCQAGKGGRSFFRDDMGYADVSDPPCVKYGVRSPKFIWDPCVQLYSLAVLKKSKYIPLLLIGWDPATPLPLHLGSYTGALLVSQDRRHLFVSPCVPPSPVTNPRRSLPQQLFSSSLYAFLLYTPI